MFSRAEEESVAAIMDIKFANVVVEILIQNWQQIFRSTPDMSPPKPANSHQHAATQQHDTSPKSRPPVATTSQSPPRGSNQQATSPATRPPPYVAPPPPPTQ